MKKKVKKKKKLFRGEPRSFSDLMWFPKINSYAMVEVAVISNLHCVCFLPTTPARSSIYFHVKEAGYA